jgi:hypothetical protein
MFSFRKPYFFITILLFVIEVLIALFVHDAIVRPYIGDLLVVILVYCFIRSFLRAGVLRAAIASLLFSYLVEFLQYINIVQKLGFQDSKIFSIVVGTSFEWIDMLAYTVGIAVVLIVERVAARDPK